MVGRYYYTLPSWIVGALQNSFPYDAVNDIIRRYLGQRYFGVEDNDPVKFSNYISSYVSWLSHTLSCVVFGLTLTIFIGVLGFVICSSIFLKPPQQKPSKKLKKWCWFIILLIFVVILGLFFLCIFSIGIGLYSNQNFIRNLKKATVTFQESSYTILSGLNVTVENAQHTIAQKVNSFDLNPIVQEFVTDATIETNINYRNEAADVIKELDPTMTILKGVEDVLEDVQVNVQDFLSPPDMMMTLNGLSEALSELHRRCGTVSECTDFLPPSLDPVKTISTITDDFGDIFDLVENIDSLGSLFQTALQVSDENTRISALDAVKSKTMEAISDTTNSIQIIIDNLNNTIDDYVASLANKIIYVIYIWEIATTISWSVLLLAVLIILVFVLYEQFRDPQSTHHIRRKLSGNSEACLVIAIIVVFWLVAFGCLIGTIVFFISSNLHALCQVISPPHYAVVTNTIDNKDAWGGRSLLSVISTSETGVDFIDWNLTQILRECDNGGNLVRVIGIEFLQAEDLIQKHISSVIENLAGGTYWNSLLLSKKTLPVLNDVAGLLSSVMTQDFDIFNSMTISNFFGSLDGLQNYFVNAGQMQNSFQAAAASRVGQELTQMAAANLTPSLVSLGLEVEKLNSHRPVNVTRYAFQAEGVNVNFLSNVASKLISSIGSELIPKDLEVSLQNVSQCSYISEGYTKLYTLACQQSLNYLHGLWFSYAISVCSMTCLLLMIVPFCHYMKRLRETDLAKGSGGTGKNKNPHKISGDAKDLPIIDNLTSRPYSPDLDPLCGDLSDEPKIPDK